MVRLSGGYPLPVSRTIVVSPNADQSGADSMSPQANGVLIAIDWENIRRSAQVHQRKVRPVDVPVPCVRWARYSAR